MVHKVQGLGDRLVAEGVNVHPPHGDRQGLLLQPAAPAGGAGALAHALLQLLPGGVGLGLGEPPLHVVQDALKGLLEGTHSIGPVVGELQFLPLRAVEDDLLGRRGKVLEGGAQVKVVLLGQGLEVHPGDGVPLHVLPAGDGDGPVQDGQGGVGDHQLGVGLHLAAQTGAGGAGPEGAVEGEHPGGELLDGDAAVLAGVVLGEGEVLVLLHQVDEHQAAPQGGGGLHRIGEAAEDVRPDHQPVHHDLDVVLLVLLHGDVLGELIEDPVHPAADVAGLPGVFQHLGVLPLLPPDHRGQHLDPGALGEGEDLVDDLVDGLLADLLAALGAVGGAHPGPQQAEVVVDLRHRAHGGPGVLAGGLLVNGDGGGEAVDVVHIGLLHLAQEHPGVGGEGLHIPPLPLGIDGVEGQGGLSRSGQAGDHHQLVPGEGDVDIFQVVGAGALDVDVCLHRGYRSVINGMVPW